jgi:tetratricopeptide (TPR) repeat protein/roadblock/LC7 domain-containing protein
MKKLIFRIAVPVAVVLVFIVVKLVFFGGKQETITILYPFNETVYPADMAAPSFAWEEKNPDVHKWTLSLTTKDAPLVEDLQVSEAHWKPSEELWSSVIKGGSGKIYTLEIYGISTGKVSEARVKFSISADSVNAPIFFRSVPLPFKFARENMKNLIWHLGDVSSKEKPHVILQNMPVCANCHSFSLDGKTLGMDVDAMNDKGSYVITSFEADTKFATDSINSWSNFQKDKYTYGLLSQVSPDGRFAVSTLGDCEIFVERNEIEYSQLFFPFKGILVIYDRKERRYYPLPGANDTMLVQSNPSWTPDGKYILFARAQAKHYEESGIQNGSVPKTKDREKYKVFEKRYLDRDSLIKYDLYKIPFNDGKGGKAEPIAGASGNGMSNYFPKVSPDGKWLVFCQAESFMLLQRDSKLVILPFEGGQPRLLISNSDNLNSWHSWSPNSKWLVFSSKRFGFYTQLFLTHINDDGTDTPPVYLDNFSFEKFANNIPEFVNTKYSKDFKIDPTFMNEDEHLIRNGELLDIAGDIQGAFEAFDEAARKFPSNADAYYKRGYMYYKKAEMKQALSDLNKALSLDKKLDYYTLRGRIRMKLGDEAHAVPDFREAIRLDSTDYMAYSKLGIILMHQNKNDEAIACLQKAVKLNNEDFFSHYNLGLGRVSRKQYNEAIASFNTAILFCADPALTPMIFEWRGNCQDNLGNYHDAITDYMQAISMAPQRPSAYYFKGKAELNAGQKQDAISSLKQAEALGHKKAGELLKTLGN